MSFEKPENTPQFETQTKYGLNYWKLGGNEKLAHSNYSVLTRTPYPHPTPPLRGYKHKKRGDQESLNLVLMICMNVQR